MTAKMTHIGPNVINSLQHRNTSVTFHMMQLGRLKLILCFASRIFFKILCAMAKKNTAQIVPVD